MTSQTTAPVRTTRGRTVGKRPVLALVAFTLTVLLAAVGSYGAVYFSSGDGVSDMEANFLLGYLAISAYALVSALLLLRGREAGRVGVAFYGLWLVLFNGFHVLYIKDLGALPFGLVGALITVSALAPATRRWTGAADA